MKHSQKLAVLKTMTLKRFKIYKKIVKFAELRVSTIKRSQTLESESGKLFHTY